MPCMCFLPLQAGCLQLVMEYCPSDLAHLLKACYHPLPVPIIKSIMRQMLLGMQACHAAGNSYGLCIGNGTEWNGDKN